MAAGTPGGPVRAFHLLLVASFTIATSGPAYAAGRSIEGGDLDTFARLLDARALADEKLSGPGGLSRRASIEAEFQAALKEAGWSTDRFEKSKDIVDTATAYLDAVKEDPASAKDFWEGNEQVESTTIDLVKARRAQFDRAPGRARQVLRDQQVAELFGRLASKADLQGTWKRDAAATKAHLMSAMHMDEAQALEVLKVQVEQTFTFSGDQVESRQTVNGRADAYKGTYQVSGRDVAFTYGKRTDKLQVGVKSPRELVFGYMGIPTGVYLKQ
jgi:hypothetical protein